VLAPPPERSIGWTRLGRGLRYSRKHDISHVKPAVPVEIGLQQIGSAPGIAEPFAIECRDGTIEVDVACEHVTGNRVSQRLLRAKCGDLFR
jgi:hypothetical protein